ncbi:MAG: GNAT family N-acetyltransferase [Bacilli bacterium]|jgi:tRNA A37 threonylcarbamoyladenosine dehydratase/predicted acetyltransferase|nr:GNAT family N-acetyltransferase [Bacilli bacterium]
MNNQFQRLSIMYQDDLIKIQNNCVVIVGIGGVGSYAAETLARCGINKLVIIDKDVVDETNINRQLIALHSTINQAKVDVMAKRIYDINPDCQVIKMKLFLNEETFSLVLKEHPDFIIDACDTIETKFLIINKCLENNIPFICSMGAANKIRADLVTLSTLSKTYNDPIAKVLRNKVKKAHINQNIPVVFSAELPFKPQLNSNEQLELTKGKRRKELPLLSSNAFVPSTFGIVAANYCFNYLSTNINHQKHYQKQLNIIIPSMVHKEMVMYYKEQFIKNNDLLNGCGYLDEISTYEEWLSDTYSAMNEATVKPEWVHSLQYLALDNDNNLIGMAQLRLVLNDFLSKYGGHIGLSIAPKYRLQGYALTFLKEMIAIAFASGIDPIMITCDINNIASKKLIQKCGGILQDVVYCQLYDVNIEIFLIKKTF